LTNYFDMSRGGGMSEGPVQAINVVVNVLTTIVVIVALKVNTRSVLGTLGDWTILSGLLQLGTTVRRWKRFGAKWAMILSGAQSALAGAFFTRASEGVNVACYFQSDCLRCGGCYLFSGVRAVVVCEPGATQGPLKDWKTTRGYRMAPSPHVPPGDI
jgi:hypothetical protein